MAAAAGSGRASLRRLGMGLAAGSLFAAALLVAAAVYLAAWFVSVRGELTDTPRSVAARAQLMDDIRERLGHAGFLRSLALFAETGSPDALNEMGATLEAAEIALRAFETQGLSAPETALARDMRRLLESYRKTMQAGRNSPAGFHGASGAMLMAQHAALVDRIADVRRGQIAVAIDQAAAMAERGFWLGAIAVGVMLLAILMLVLMIQGRVIRPLASLRRSLAGVAKGDWRAPVWGVERKDEFGDLARTVDAFRQQAAAIPDISVMSEAGRLRLRFEGGAADLFEAVSSRLREAGAAMEANSTAVAETVTRARAELTQILAQVQSLCLAVAKSTAESSREVRQATEVLSRAARQVSAFDDQGPGGGLDGLVRNLRQNAEFLAETVRTTGEEVGYTLKSLVGSENHLRAATMEARETTTKLGESLLDVQEKLLAAVKLLRASGELIATTAGDADSTLARAAAAVGEGERSLAIALDLASARFAEITDRMGRAVTAFEERSDTAEARFDTAVETILSAGRLVEQSAEVNAGRLAPIVGELQTLQGDMAAATAEVGAKAAMITAALAELREVGDALRDEFERRRVEPDRRAAAEATIQRLQAIAELLGDRLREVEDTAGRLGSTLAAGLDDATARLNDAAAEVRNESRSLSADAASATNALSRAVQRQDEATESLRDIAAQLSLVNLEPPAPPPAPPPPPPEPDPQTVEALRVLADLAENLQSRLDGMDRLSQGLAQATDTLRELAVSGAPANTAATQATQDLGNRLADIADQLRIAASGMQSLANNGKTTA